VNGFEKSGPQISPVCLAANKKPARATNFNVHMVYKQRILEGTYETIA